MNSRTVTGWVLGIGTLVVIGWDIYLAANGVEGDTISEKFLHTSMRIGTLPLALGVVVGHLTWPTKNVPPRWLCISALGSVTALSIVADLFGAPRSSAIGVVLGFFLGHAFWPQRVK